MQFRLIRPPMHYAFGGVRRKHTKLGDPEKFRVTLARDFFDSAGQYRIGPKLRHLLLAATVTLSYGAGPHGFPRPAPEVWKEHERHLCQGEAGEWRATL